jgi:hypothetical protein
MAGRRTVTRARDEGIYLGIDRGADSGAWAKMGSCRRQSDTPLKLSSARAFPSVVLFYGVLASGREPRETGCSSGYEYRGG